MAAFTLFGRVLVEEDLLPLKLAVVLMAAGARHVLVEPLKRELGLLVVVKQRRLPLGGIVTIDTGGHAVLGELLAVDIFVAVFALGGSGREVRLDQLGLHIGRLMAVDAGRGPVRPQQRERSLGMVKARELIPFLRGMAGLAASRDAIHESFPHALGKLAIVRILVAGFARQILPMVEHRRLGRSFRMLRLLMTVRADHGNVAPGEREMRVLVPLQGKRRGLVPVERVALFAFVQIGRIRELAVMVIMVAVHTLFELDLVLCLFTLRDVALVAIDFEVPSFQRVVARGVVLGGERGRLPSVHRVAPGTFNALRTLRELPGVRIGQVAVRTLGEWNFFLEIATLVAGAAIDGRVFSKQRILGLGMIKTLAHRRQGNLLPATGRVAGFAGLREAAVVRIGVAIRALAERDPGIARFAVGARRVAFFALHLRVQSRQWIARFTVIEFSDGYGFPVRVVVALQTILPEAALVLVFMAGSTGLGQAEERPGQVLDLDDRPRGRRNPCLGVALGAFDPLVFPFQNVSGQLMVEGLGVPFDEREILAIVLGVALGTFLVDPFGNVVGRVQAFAGSEATGDLRMAAQALQRGGGTELVAVRAVQSAIQRLVRAGEGAG